MKIRVYYEDTDCMGVVYHSNYLNYCERARSEVFFANGGSEFLQKNSFALREVNAVYKAPAKLGDELEIINTPLGYDKFCMSIKQEIYKDKQLLFVATVKLVHLKDSKLAPIDEELKEFLNKAFKNS